MTSVANVLRTRLPNETGKAAVKYTPCNKGEQTDEEELEEIEVVQDVISCQSFRTHSMAGSPDHNGESSSKADSEETSNKQTITTISSPAANGPRALPGSTATSISSSLPHFQQKNTDRTKLIGERLAGSAGRINVSSPVYSQKQSNGSSGRNRAASRNSIFEIVTNRIDHAKANNKRMKDYSHAVYVNKAHNPEPMTPKQIRKLRKKDIEAKFGKNKKKYERVETSTEGSGEKDGCKWTFVFDPAGRFAYWWSAVISVAFIYNFWVIVYRFAFEEINRGNISLWFTLDYTADFLYVLDIVFHFRTGYLEDGVLQTDSTKLRLHYMNSTMFYIDCLCLLPLDFLYLSIGFKSMLRCFRLVKIYRFWAFLDRTERHTNYPNVVRTVNLLHYLIAVYHWNACVMYTVIRHLESKSWNFPTEDNDVFRNYLHSLYYSTLTLTTIGDLPTPKLKGEYVFVIVQFIFGLLMFSAVLGHVANIVASISFARKDFQAKLDSVKTYMTLRRVPLRLQDRVIKWFDYLWLSKKSSDEEKTLNLLPDKLKAEIALHVHLDTLKRVEIFQNTEAGFLCELVLKLRPVLFSPGDFICTKGEVGKEMYIVSRGRLQVVADGGKTVLATLRPGSYFGEISILNMGNEGNRRTASVRSVGYSDLFVLAKKDLWDVLKDYPAARVRLEAIAVKRLEKYKKAPLENETIPRCKSTPGLLESEGKIPLENMTLSRHNTLPSSLHQRRSYDSNIVQQPSSSLSGSGQSETPNSHRSSGRESASAKEHHNGVEKTPHNNTADGSSHVNSAELTRSMTVSSLTSLATDNSQHSPRLPEMTKSIQSTSSYTAPFIGSPSAFKPVLDSHSSPQLPQQQPQTQQLQLQQDIPEITYGGPVRSGTEMAYGGPVVTSYQLTSSPTRMLNPPITYLATPGGITPISPMSSPSMCHRGFQTHPPSGTHPSNFQNILSGPSVAAVSGNIPTGGNSGVLNLLQMSSGSLNITGCHSNGGNNAAAAAMSLQQQQRQVYHDSNQQQQQQLIAELTQLKTRLQALEGENIAMNAQLKKQQWNMERRKVTGIEMTVRSGSSSGSCQSAEDKDFQENRESII